MNLRCLGVSGKAMLSAAGPIVAILLILASILTVIVENTITGLKNTDMSNQFWAVSEQVSTYFDIFFVDEKFVSNLDAVQQIFSETERIPIRSGLKLPHWMEK